MDLERGRVIEIVVSVAAVVTFVAVLIAIGFYFDQAALNADGGLALVGAIAAFIVLMGGVGVFLAYTLNDE